MMSVKRTKLHTYDHSPHQIHQLNLTPQFLSKASNTTMATLETANILSLGAIIQNFHLPDGTSLVQGFPTPDLYVQYNEPYFGETIGRVANRIAGAQIDSLNGGKTYKLNANNGPNTLHGGNVGWGKKQWMASKEDERLKLQLTSPDGDEGFPGTVHATVWYKSAQLAMPGGQLGSELEIEYEATLEGPDEVEETVIAMTNHSYFNLSGGASIEGTQVTLSTNQHLPVDDTLIPTGTIEPFPGIEAGKAFTLGLKNPEVDRCFIVDPTNEPPSSIPIDTRQRSLRLLGSFYHPDSKAHLEVHSTEPAFQFYTGEFIDVPEITGSDGETVAKRGPRSGFCVEPGRYVNAVNTPQWGTMVRLNKGQKYGSKIRYFAWKD
jgi:aldose 1-epimerase